MNTKKLLSLPYSDFILQLELLKSQNNFKQTHIEWLSSAFNQEELATFYAHLYRELRKNFPKMGEDADYLCDYLDFFWQACLDKELIYIESKFSG